MTDKKVRPKSLPGNTVEVETGCGPMYVTLNSDKDGLFEVFVTMGKAGGCAASQIEAIGRLVSLALRSGVQPYQITKQLSGICCHSALTKEGEKIASCADAVAKVIKQHITIE